MLGREVVDLARDLAVDVASVEHQDLVLALGGLGPVEVPELARDGARVKEVGANGDHHVHIAGLDDLAAYLLLAVPGTRSLGGHHEAAAPLVAQITPEVGDPEVVAVADLLLLVYSWQAEGQARVALDPFGVHEVYVERRIRHHEVALAGEAVLVLIIGDGLRDLAFQAVHREVHLGDADGVSVLLLSVEDDLLRSVAAFVLDEVAALDEHAARAACRVEDGAVVGFDDVDDGLHDRGRREELAVVVRLLDRELGEEILVDASEDVAGSLLDLLAVEEAHEVLEHLGLEDPVVL